MGGGGGGLGRGCWGSGGGGGGGGLELGCLGSEEVRRKQLVPQISLSQRTFVHYRSVQKFADSAKFGALITSFQPPLAWDDISLVYETLTSIVSIHLIYSFTLPTSEV